MIPVIWKNTVNVSFIDNSLTKISGGSGWNAGAISRQMLHEGDGYVETTIANSETETNRFIGLSKTSPDAGRDSIEFGIYLLDGSRLWVMESGVTVYNSGTYTSNDVVRVEVAGTSVLYKKNGITLYTSSVILSENNYPLLVDTSIHSDTGTLIDVMVKGFEDPIPETLSIKPVKWINQVNVSSSENELQKTSGTTQVWNSGAVSSQILISGDGYVETKLEDKNSNRMIGLSKGDTDQHHDDIDFAIYVHTTRLYAYKNGTSLFTGPDYVINDIIRLEVSGSDVLYKQNGIPFYTLNNTIDIDSYPLLVDTSLFESNAVLKNVIVSSSFKETPSPLYLKNKFVRWSNVSNICVEGQRLEKIAGLNAWDAGAISVQSVPQGNCYVETKLTDNYKDRMFGFNKGNPGYGTDIDFAVSLHSDGTFRVYESGIEINTFGHYYTGDIVRIEINEDSVFYRVNGEIRFAHFNVIDSSSYPLMVDVSMKEIGATLHGVHIGSEALSRPQALIY